MAIRDQYVYQQRFTNMLNIANRCLTDGMAHVTFRKEDISEITPQFLGLL